MIRFSLICCSLLFAACAAPVDDAPLSKSDARAQVAKGDFPFDFCDAFGWYGDGICDDFCANPDPDCDGDQYCYSDDECASGESCNADEICLSDCPAGAVCPQVCAGFCVEEPPVDECWGAWTDQFGNCRAPNDAAYPDECCATSTCGGFDNLPCEDDEWCSFGNPPNDAAADMSGVCMPRPEFCPELFAPVCGTDGNTYNNSCFANQAGMDVDHEGECAPPPLPQFCIQLWAPVCGTDGNTYSNSCFAAQAGMDVDHEGECAPRPVPQFCIQLWAPVCGTDGNTYSNSCFAAQAAVEVAHTGACL